MNARMNALLAHGRMTVLEPQVKALEEMLHSSTYGGSEGGTLGATNVTPVQDELDTFLVDIVDGIVQQYEVDKDEAFDFVMETADSLAASGDLPDMPDDNSSDEEVVAWLAAARSMGFAAYAMEAAERDSSGESEEMPEGEPEGEPEDMEMYSDVVEAAALYTSGQPISEELVAPVRLLLQQRAAKVKV